MTLATRCAACGTVFRAEQDQLQASDGWVRCGRCNSVFNAAEGLFDIETVAPVVPPGPHAAHPVRHSGVVPAGPATPPRHEAPLLRTASSDGDSDDTIHIIDQPPPPPSALALNPMDGPLGRLVGLDGVLGQTTMGAQQPARDPHNPVPAPTTHPAPAPAFGPPSFLRAADRHAWWRRPAVRSGTAVAAVLLGAAALLQTALLAHDSLAAHLPATAPALRALCRVAGCQLQALRRLDALAVGSSGLNRMDDGALYRLQLVLHNRADTAVMMPALELSLTDGQGQLVSRRVLRLADLGLAPAVFKAGQDVPVKVVLAAGEQRIDGYTLELFYP